MGNGRRCTRMALVDAPDEDGSDNAARCFMAALQRTCAEPEESVAEPQVEATRHRQ
jgi:hypothetical protein